MKNIIIIGIAIYLLILLINIVGIYNYYRKSPNSSIRTLFFYLIFLLLFQIITSALALQSINNLVLSHVFFVSQFFILAYFFNQLINLSSVTKLIRIYVIGALSFLLIQYLLFPNLIWNFNIAEVFITNYLSILLSLIYFYKNLGKKKEYQPFVIGILIYSTMSTSIFLFGNVASYIDIKSAVYIWGAHLITLLIYQLLITVQWLSKTKLKVS